MKQLEIKQMRDYIVEMLLEQIMSGSLKKGTKLTQEEIAKRTQVSRMPVREALQSLEQDGFLTRLPNRHIEVIGVSKKNIYSTFNILAAIETEFVMILLRNDTDISLLKLELVKLEKSLSQGNSEEQLNSEVNFQLILSKLVKNQYLENLHTKFLTTYFHYAIRKSPRKPEEIFYPLRNILHCLEEGKSQNISDIFNEYYEPLISLMIEGGDYE